jgi:hypothetical protein
MHVRIVKKGKASPPAEPTRKVARVPDTEIRERWLRELEERRKLEREQLEKLFGVRTGG